MKKLTPLRKLLRGKALALATLRYIKRYPHKWNQSEWRADKACCFVARAVLLSKINIDLETSSVTEAGAKVLKLTDDIVTTELFGYNRNLKELEAAIARLYPE